VKSRGDTYVLNERALVLEGVTLGEVVELVVEVLVDLAAGAVLDEETAENPLAAHPQDLPVLCVSRHVRATEFDIQAHHPSTPPQRDISPISPAGARISRYSGWT
jgi:hypothetical protein